MHIVKHMQKNEDAWVAFMSSPEPEKSIPAGCYETTPFDQAEEAAFESFPEPRQQLHRNVKSAIRDALVIKAMRPDRLLLALANVVEMICGKEFLQVSEVLQEDLHAIVTKQLKPIIPVVLVSAPGFDPSSKVLWAAQKQNQNITSIAMGSEEGYAVADKAIASAARQGTWVLLKNVHLSSSWLADLEKRLFRMQFHDNFRVFMSMEFSSKVQKCDLGGTIYTSFRHIHFYSNS